MSNRPNYLKEVAAHQESMEVLKNVIELGDNPVRVTAELSGSLDTFQKPQPQESQILVLPNEQGPASLIGRVATLNH
jgi:hypothetical protein